MSVISDDSQNKLARPKKRRKKSSGTKLTLYDYLADGKKFTESGSHWGPLEMELFRICYKKTRDPLWKKSPPATPSNPASWKLFLEGSDSLPCLTNAEIRSQLAETSGFFLALANILRNPSTLSGDSACGSRQRPKRVMKQRQFLEQASKQSIREAIDSSSPIPEPSSQASSFGPESNMASNELEDEQERKQLEVASSSLASEFISLVIDLFLDQPSQLKKRLAFKEAPTQFHIINTENTANCQSWDDGSIIWHERDQDFDPWRFDGHVCSVETKSGFTVRDKEGKGRISQQTIQQYACEMIGAAMQRSDERGLKNRAPIWQPLIVTHSCHITILSATFTRRYLDYSKDEHNDRNSEPPSLDIYCTKTCDLSTPDGRKKAAEDLLALCERLRAGGSTGNEEEVDKEKEKEKEEDEDEDDDNETEEEEEDDDNEAEEEKEEIKKILNSGLNTWR